jgi:ubiquinone/menaquinone biosynthesis C-methylase UbiE
MTEGSKEGGPGDGGHGHHHDGKYAWTAEEADRFLERSRRRGRRIYPRLAAQVTGLLAGRGEDATVVDLGTGPGLLLAELRRSLPRARLVGVDPSKDMLALARRVATEGRGDDGPAFETAEGSGESVPLEDASADVVVCRNVLHEFDDAPRAMAEMARVLRPGGRLVLQDFNGAYPRWKLGLMVALVRLAMGRDAAHGLTRPFMDSFSMDGVVGLLTGAGLRPLETSTKGYRLAVVAERPRP